MLIKIMERIPDNALYVREWSREFPDAETEKGVYCNAVCDLVNRADNRRIQGLKRIQVFAPDSVSPEITVYCTHRVSSDILILLDSGDAEGALSLIETE